MTDPHQNPFGNNPIGGDPFGGAPFGQGAQGGPPVVGAAPASPSPAGVAANTLATLSLVFAFVFAPAGAVLGHLGLSQIARTGQRGRDRALIGLTLSYAVIAVAVIALIWVSLADNGSRRQVASPASRTPPAAVSTTTTTTTTPPPPIMAPADLAGLLPSADDDKRITGNQKLTLRDAVSEMSPDPGTVDNDNCWSALLLLSSHHYDLPAISGIAATQDKDITGGVAHPSYVQQGVAAFRDAAGAQRQLASLTDKWRHCGGATVANTQSTGNTITYVFTPPVPEANGVTTIECTQRFPAVPDPPLRIARALAAKNNVVVDVAVAFRQSGSSQHNDALDIANFILDKIPGPR